MFNFFRYHRREMGINWISWSCETDSCSDILTLYSHWRTCSFFRSNHLRSKASSPGATDSDTDPGAAPVRLGFTMGREEKPEEETHMEPENLLEHQWVLFGRSFSFQVPSTQVAVVNLPGISVVNDHPCQHHALKQHHTTH